MAIVNDIKELKYLFDTNTNDYDLHTYNKEEYTFINDTQSTAQVIMFDNQSVQNMLTTLYDAWLDIPLVFKRSTGTAYSSNNLTKNVAFKISADQIFSGFHYTLANSQTICNEQHSLPLINGYRKLNRFNALGLNQKAIESQYYPDNFPYLEYSSVSPYGVGLNNTTRDFNQAYGSTITAGSGTTATQADTIVTGATTTFVAGMVGGMIQWADGRIDTIVGFTDTTHITVAKSRTIASSNYTIYFNAASGGTAQSPTIRNPFYNEGLARRIQYRKLNTTPESGATDNFFTVHCIVPLSEVHDVIKQLGFPITNMRQQFRFELAYPMNTSSIFNCILGASGDVPDSVTFVTGTARMYVKNITLNPDDNIKLQQALSAGITKNIAFTETQLYTVATAKTLSGTETLTISTSISNVQRLILFAVPTGALLSNTMSANPTVKFGKVALKINNIPERTFQLGQADAVPMEYFQLVKEHTHFGGASDTDSSLINYQTYLQNYYNYYVYDFERLGVRPDKRNPISIAVELSPYNGSTVSSGGDKLLGAQPVFDLYCLVEIEARIQLSFDTNSTRVIKSYA